MNYFFLKTNFALKLQGKCWKDEVVTFTAHLSITIKRFFGGRHVGGQEYALQHGGQYKSYYFVEKSKCHKISPLKTFPLKFRLYDNFYVLCQFLASARFQLIVWSRDLLVQVAYCSLKWIPRISSLATLNNRTWSTLFWLMKTEKNAIHAPPCRDKAYRSEL